MTKCNRVFFNIPTVNSPAWNQDVLKDFNYHIRTKKDNEEPWRDWAYFDL